MSIVTATVEFAQDKGTVKFSLDLQGATELDHEILAAAIGSGRSVSIVPAHKGDELFAEFTVADTSIWPRATRALENRKRVADGRPTVEEEEAQAAMRAASAEDYKKEQEAIAQKRLDDEQARQDATDRHTAEVASEAVAQTLKRLATSSEHS